MTDVQLIEDFGFLKMYLRHEVYAEDFDLIKAGSEFVTLSLEGPAKTFYRQYTFQSTLVQFFRNDYGLKDEAYAVLFGSARKLANDIQKCLSEAGAKDEISGTYKYVPKASYNIQAINNLSNNQ